MNKQNVTLQQAIEQREAALEALQQAQDNLDYPGCDDDYYIAKGNYETSCLIVDALSTRENRLSALQRIAS